MTSNIWTHAGRNEFRRLKKLLRRQRKSSLRKRRRNFHRNSIKRSRGKIKRKFKNRIEKIELVVTGPFCLLTSTENVISLIEQLEKHKTERKWIKEIKIDLYKITDIDIGAISALLTKVYEMSQLTSIRVWGVSPKDPRCREIFDRSGFLEYVTDLSGNKFKTQSQSFIFKVGKNKTRNERVGKVIETAVKFITGDTAKFPPVYSMVQEICSNSVEWANPNSRAKNWFLGINKIETKEGVEVLFTMTDIGEGILHTLKRKFKDIVKDVLAKDSDVLNRAFERRYGSKTEEINRNRGLPLIKSRFENGFVENLMVITNGVRYNFAIPDESTIIYKNFPGTFYFWRINKKCIERWTQPQTT